jgi:hypothetical protein
VSKPAIVVTADDTTNGLTKRELKQLIEFCDSQGVPDEATLGVTTVMNRKAFATHAPVREATFKW